MSDSWDRNSEACPSAARQEGKKQEVREKARGGGGGRRCSDCNIVSVDTSLAYLRMNCLRRKSCLLRLRTSLLHRRTATRSKVHC